MDKEELPTAKEIIKKLKDIDEDFNEFGRLEQEKGMTDKMTKKQFDKLFIHADWLNRLGDKIEKESGVDMQKDIEDLRF